MSAASLATEPLGAPSHDTEERRQARRVLLSSYLGSVVEFYDFLVYGTAASLVFGRVFFADADPLVGTIAAFGTLAVGYLARPLGGIIFGHFGDRLGRKRMLVLTMTLMGLASTAIGLLPTQSQVGSLAPVLLVLLRLVQGLALGGEWGGATLMALEHAGSRRRGFFAAIVNAGAPTGAVLAAAVMGAFSLLSKDAFLSWGWRVPFLISAVLVAVALWVRLGVRESPLFLKAMQNAQELGLKKPAMPLLEVLRHPKAVLQTCLGGAGALAFQTLLATFFLTYAILSGADRTLALFAAAIGSFVNVFTLPLFGALSDRLGRKPVLIGGYLAGVVLAYPILRLIGSGNPVSVVVGYVIGYGLIVACLMGTLSSFISEQFATTSRYTGASLGYQLAATLGGGFAPLIATRILAASGGKDAGYVAVFIGAAFVVGAVAVLLTRESFRRDITD